MVLIISEKEDITTDRVIDWLCHIGVKGIVRINDGEPIFIEKISLSSYANPIIALSIKDVAFTLDDIKFFWYRRGAINFEINNQYFFDNNLFNNYLTKFLVQEWRRCKDYIISKLEEKPKLGDYFKANTNKIQNLEKAQSVGFKIPETFISQYKKSLSSYASEMADYITKPISSCFKCSDDNYELFSGVNAINSNTIDFADCYSSPQLLQQRIEKWIEIRVFVFFDKLFPMAIFSQNNEQTRVDYRTHDFNNVPRSVPFKLPCSIEERVLAFMRSINLTTGSVDLILTPEREYVFLEVNPAGVIDMVATPCNYHIEKEIALAIKRLINE
jgi:ATP-GRASP peptide maturase of grasp-with-spasm system